MSGYTPCTCRDCFDIAISDDDARADALCWACKEAGCEPASARVAFGLRIPVYCLCQRADAYGGDVTDEEQARADEHDATIRLYADDGEGA